MSKPIQVEQLREVLAKFNEDLVVYINDNLHNRLGRVLTIIDACNGDPEQRKAVKDLIRDGWWENRGEHRSVMGNPHTDLRAICEVFGFELYPASPDTFTALPFDDTEFAKSRYEKIQTETN